MTTPAEFLHMGGYALYVWSAWGVTAMVLTWNALAASRRERALLRELAARGGSRP